MARNFNGKVLLITGAARGIGAGVAREYVARGGQVAILGLEPDLLEELSDELGDNAAWWLADVRDADAVDDAVNAAAKHFGRIDHVVANAGIASYGTVRQVDDEAFSRVVDINVNGVYRTLHSTIPHLEKTKGYALVIASLASFTNLAGLASYNASKAGAEALGLVTRMEVAHLGIGVGVCHPSWIDTDIVRGAEADLPTFRKIRRKLPPPANSTTSLEDCVSSIIDGMLKRKARVYVPGTVGVVNYLKPVLNSVPVMWAISRIGRKDIPKMEAEVDALGRFQHAHVPLTKPKG